MWVHDSLFASVYRTTFHRETIVQRGLRRYGCAASSTHEGSGSRMRACTARALPGSADLNSLGALDSFPDESVVFPPLYVVFVKRKIAYYSPVITFAGPRCFRPSHDGKHACRRSVPLVDLMPYETM